MRLLLKNTDYNEQILKYNEQNLQKQQELEQTESDEDEAQQAIQEGIAKAEQEGKVVVDELAQTHKSVIIKNKH